MKIGIAGSGKIVTEALNAMNEIDEIKINAICGRENSIDKLRKFANDYQISKIYTDYNEMLNDDEVEVIYIAIINKLHFEYTKKALEAGKHVICEKPFTSNFEEIKTLSELAMKKKLFMFEAITLLYSPNFKYIKENVQKLGDIKLIQCNYSQYSSRYDKYLEKIVEPVFDLSMSGGTLYDLNIYNIHFVLALFGEPNKVNYKANLGFNGVDTSGVVILSYNNFTAICCGAKDSESPSFATIQGNKGYLKINSAVNSLESVEVFLDKKISNYSKRTSDNRMVDEFIAFYRMYKEKNFTGCYKYLEHSMLVMEVLVEARKDANITFLND